MVLYVKGVCLESIKDHHFLLENLAGLKDLYSWFMLTYVVQCKLYHLIRVDISYYSSMILVVWLRSIFSLKNQKQLKSFRSSKPLLRDKVVMQLISSEHIEGVSSYLTNLSLLHKQCDSQKVDSEAHTGAERSRRKKKLNYGGNGKKHVKREATSK